MDSLYLDELRSTISQLMLNLESLPVSKGGTDSKYGLQKLKRYNQRYVSLIVFYTFLPFFNVFDSLQKQP